MKKKRCGHYCFMCGRYRANEKFSGKGHRKHICKDCQRKGKTEELHLNVQSTHNPFIKQLKVKLIEITKIDGYIFFDINQKTYVIHDFDEVIPKTFKYIYKSNKEPDLPFELTNELDHHKDEILEALLIKCEEKYH